LRALLRNKGTDTGEQGREAVLTWQDKKMNKQTLIWTLILAVPVGLAALATAYVYRDTGHLPFQKPAETVSAPSAQPDSSESQAVAGSSDQTSGSGKTAQTEVVQNQDGSDVAPEAPVAGPSFDVVGVEPTGETVVAGRSDAGAIVALTANGKVVGKSIANEAGEWTIILDEPLKPGDYDVALEVHDEKGASIEESEQRLAVSVPEGGNEQPLVVLNTADGPSDILQKPEAEQQVAQSGGTSSATNEQVVAAADQSKPRGTQSGETVVAAAKSTTEQAPAPTEPPVAVTENTTNAPAPVENETAAAPAATDGTASDQPSAPETAEAPGNQEQDTQLSNVGDEKLQSQSQDNQNTTANIDGSEPAVPATTETAQPLPVEKPTTTDAAPQPTETAVASSDGQQEQAPSAVTVTAEASAPPAQKPQLEIPAPTVTVEAVESEKDKVFVAGTGEPGSSVRVYVGDDFQGEAQVNSSGKWLVQGDKNVPEGNVEVRADLVGEDGNSVDARAAVTFEKAQEQQIVLTKVVATGAGGGAQNQGAEVQRALPVVIIRKGDNLWRISRRLYGDGVRYTTIYQANQDQIRNPDLIYPGQVFLTPEGDLNWPQPKEDTGRNG
jgi:nucleoid-associated protein YgaU